MKVVVKDYRIDPSNPSTLLIAEMGLESYEVSLTGNEQLISYLTSHGIVGREGGTKYYPKDGNEFLKRLPEYYTNGYVRAEIVE